jgi:hypothetical protein
MAIIGSHTVTPPWFFLGKPGRGGADSLGEEGTLWTGFHVSLPLEAWPQWEVAGTEPLILAPADCLPDLAQQNSHLRYF